MDRECDDLSASCAARHQPDSATEFTASDVDVDHAGQLDISKFKTEQPTQPILNPFPSKKYGKLTRSFNSNWYRLFPWLEYSAQADAAFCYPCRMFSTGDNEKSAFVNGGYSNWKNALERDGGFRKHENSLVHKTCQASWVSFTQMKAGGQSRSVATHLSDAYSREVQENHLYIARVADILRFTAIQEISQRGHDESARSENKGNFVELLNLFAKYDDIIGKKLNGGAANAKYVHHSIQDQILEILSHITLTSIKEEMKSSQCFALIVNETKDLRKTEQLSVVVRYYLNGAVFERAAASQRYTMGLPDNGLHSCHEKLSCHSCMSQRSRRYKQQAGNGSRGLLEQMNFSFLFHLRLFIKLLSRLKVFSDILQSKDCNLSQACFMAHTVIDELSEIRNSQSAFDTVWEQTCTIPEENGVPQRKKQRTKRLPLHLEQFVLSEGRPVEEESPDSKETFRVKVFLPVLDHLIVELTRRFAENNDELCGVSALHPQSENFMDVSLLKPFAEHYACDINSVEVECKLVIKLLQRIEAERKCKIETLVQLVTVLEEYKLAFHELHKLSVITVTIPASSSSCERTFFVPSKTEDLSSQQND
ncbi:hypothetical protein HPB51_018848 [Rhipicephalus microplus]|uniref:TTF-type domain-containing protein n=1 Tax=Rhipicephalus microplus TaxID=6941 RepID=A0A9J6DP99_RHIMP|nr:hypothetical protein HPB51_018848 [Rhipicephalus microplus]